ncbi:hypothetical protein ACRAWD_26980 [Caulobacter segnis]
MGPAVLPLIDPKRASSTSPTRRPARGRLLDFQVLLPLLITTGVLFGGIGSGIVKLLLPPHMSTPSFPRSC